MSNDNEKNNQKKEEEQMVSTRPCTPTDSLEKSVKEMHLIRQGKAPKRSWRELKKQLTEEVQGD